VRGAAAGLVLEIPSLRVSWSDPPCVEFWWPADRRYEFALIIAQRATLLRLKGDLWRREPGHHFLLRSGLGTAKDPDDN